MLYCHRKLGDFSRGSPTGSHMLFVRLLNRRLLKERPLPRNHSTITLQQPTSPIMQKTKSTLNSHYLVSERITTLLTQAIMDVRRQDIERARDQYQASVAERRGINRRAVGG